jgi:Asp-tRNA(Asn)/Glu-tRNA(Gln) amidotransferase A subunit family amidase
MIEPQNELVGLSAGAAAALIREHKLGALELTEAYLQQIEASEPEVQAFAFLDPEHARGQARTLDEMRKHGRPLGPLHGLPVGVKDIIDTQDMPTENGTVLHAGRRPRADATVVSRLRAAGAVILGKTVTTELAVYAPNQTRNPHNPEHTPGGSSSGSAAAVAAHMVPLALGTQTNGSVIRPAAYCGVFGYKPSHGLISRSGILRQSPPLDTVGAMARSVEDLALLAEVLMGYDPGDPALRPCAHPRLLEIATQPPPVVPDLGFVRTPVWNQAEAETRAAFDELLATLGERASAADLPAAFDKAIELHGTIMEADLARSFAPEYERGRDRLSARLCGMIERGQQCLAVDYNRAVDAIGWLQREIERLFARYDALLTPATTGPAPHGLDATGSPVFCTMWTLCGMPAVTLPLLQAGNGLPLGVQLVGQKGDDARLLRTARWLVETLRAEVAA